MNLPFAPTLAPMLSSPVAELPGGDGWLFEPKWDGFRTLVFRDGDEILLQSRDEKPMNRYFPELLAPLAQRRERLEQVLVGAAQPVHLSLATRDRALAEDWFRRFEGAGLDGVMAKRLDAPYRAGERTMIKVKHARTADCVVAGFRWHKKGTGTMVGSLLLGLYDAGGTLHHIGVTAAFTNAVREQLVAELAPLREHALDGHPWRDWAEAQ